MNLAERESDALNFLRWTSTVAIVVCHILQGYKNDWCYVLNIGVQVFFFLSGFLYGGKRIESAGKFYRSRIIKLYVPFVICVLAGVGLLWLFAPQPPSLRQVVLQLGLLSCIKGMGQMWFMTVLFICYLFLPFVDKGVNSRPWFTFVAGVILIIIWVYFKYSAYVVWVGLYYVGYVCGRYPKTCFLCLWIAVMAFWQFFLSKARPWRCLSQKLSQANYCTPLQARQSLSGYT